MRLRYDAKIDVWAFGMLLFELLTGCVVLFVLFVCCDLRLCVDCYHIDSKASMRLMFCR